MVRLSSRPILPLLVQHESRPVDRVGEVGVLADDTLQGTTAHSFRITSSFLQNKITYIATKSFRKFARALNSDASFARFHERDV